MDTLRKNGFLGLVGKLALASFYAISTLIRIGAILIFLAPSLGLFDLLHHWKMGRISVEVGKTKVYDMEDGNPVFFHEAWEAVTESTELTLLGPLSAIIFLVLGTLAHGAAVYSLKRSSRPEVIQHQSFIARISHVVSNFVYPRSLCKWDESESSTFSDAWVDYQTEMLHLLLLFAFEHLLMCIPMWVLAWNVTSRNAFLDDKFPQLPEELVSTANVICLSIVPPIIFVVAPFLQWTILLAYFYFGHPWKTIWREEMTKLPDVPC